MIRYKIKNVSFECDEKAGTANVAVGEIVTRYTNAVEAWNVFTSKAFYPLEKHWTIVNKVDKKERKDHREESKMAGGRKLEEE